jgi:hypothetical protein
LRRGWNPSVRRQSFPPSRNSLRSRGELAQSLEALVGRRVPKRKEAETSSDLGSLVCRVPSRPTTSRLTPLSRTALPVPASLFHLSAQSLPSGASFSTPVACPFTGGGVERHSPPATRRATVGSPEGQNAPTHCRRTTGSRLRASLSPHSACERSLPLSPHPLLSGLCLRFGEFAL